MTDTEIGPVNGHVLTKLTPIPPEHIPAQPAPVVEDAPETTAPVAVDNPELPSPGVTQEKRRPILAPWLTNASDFLATTRHAGANAGYAALFHGVRLPVYALRLGLMSPAVPAGSSPTPTGGCGTGKRRPYGKPPCGPRTPSST